MARHPRPPSASSSPRPRKPDAGGGAPSAGADVTSGDGTRAAPRRAPAGQRAAGQAPAGHVVVAEFGRAHGVRGEVRLKSWTADPAMVADYGPFITEDGRSFRLEDLRPAPGGEADMFVVRVHGVSDRTAAEALARVRLYASRDRLPPLVDEDEFYLADLVGLAVENESGERIGSVLAVHDFGAGDIIEIQPLKGGDGRTATAMVAFTREFVPVVDIAGGRIVATPDPFAPADDADGPDDAA